MMTDKKPALFYYKSMDIFGSIVSVLSDSFLLSYYFNQLLVLNLNMQSVIFTVLATVALASAGGLTGSYQSQYTQHSHAVVAHSAPVVHAAVHHTPIVHSAQVVHSAPIVQHAQVLHAAPIHHAQVLHAAPIHHAVAVPAVYKTVVPTAYASSYSYRAPAAKIVKTVVQQPIVYAAPRPVYQTAAIAPIAYASAFNYRAPVAAVHHARVYTHASPIVHHAPVAVHAVHHAPIVRAVHASPVVHSVAPFGVHHAGAVVLSG